MRRRHPQKYLHLITLLKIEKLLSLTSKIMEKPGKINNKIKYPSRKKIKLNLKIILNSFKTQILISSFTKKNFQKSKKRVMLITNTSIKKIKK